MTGYLAKPGVGEFASEAAAVIRRNIVPVLIYGIFAAVVASGFDLALGEGISSSLAQMPFTFIGSYLIAWVIIRNEGRATVSPSAKGFLVSSAAGMLVGIGGVFGLVLLIVPGLLLLARWSVVSSLIIGRGVPAMDAFGESSRITKPHQWPIIGLFVLLLLAFLLFLTAIGVIIVIGLTAQLGSFSVTEWSEAPAIVVIGNLLTGLLSASAVGLNVAILNIVLDHAEGHEEIFA
ncbi:hypothetical protein WSK_0981 [Novosphingobium sp. Rr 2-17]|uniref:hypothetical protein n=1 Tax=Novosphingobium sp. Rr 2-17 TaxID=555793 RepID=UPI0002699818|nr:hypothetical protein [Novosphingobium sp. Rr 2-17]EIZ80423.1 hypothetical protein WSK_0981 [Novosphingobium sp. Rr 2-17]